MRFRRLCGLARKSAITTGTRSVSTLIAEELPSTVRIVEVGARDGLQNEPEKLSVDTKVELISRLARSGLRNIECGAFVHPKWVPQMADSDQVLKRVASLRSDRSIPSFRSSFLVPNLKGLESAIQADDSSGELREVSVFASASESFAKANTNCTIRESLNRFEPVAELARERGILLRGYVSCCLGCPYEGDSVPISNIVKVCKALSEMGCYEISVADTVGRGTPVRTQQVIEAVLCDSGVVIDQMAVHFHDTYGQALANILASLSMGVSVVDSSVSGLGGCPYAGPKASGNVATEDVVYMLHGMGIDTGLDLAQLIETAHWISAELGRPTASKVSTAAGIESD